MMSSRRSSKTKEYKRNIEFGSILNPGQLKLNNEILKDAILNACQIDHSIKVNNARQYAEKFLNMDVMLNKMVATIL